MKLPHRRKANRHHSRRHECLRTIAGFVSVGVLVGVLIFLAYDAGRANRWPEARNCVAVDSRVVVAGVVRGSMKDPVILYRGEYRIRYVVKGKVYFTWAESKWLEPDKHFVEENVSKLTTECPVHVFYDPWHPDESLTRPMP
jgi:hypothetical protein